MIKTQQIRLRLTKRQLKYCTALSQEAARVWNAVKNFHWRTYRKKGIWLSESDLKRYAKGRFGLHSQSIQAIVEKFCSNRRTAHQLRRTDPTARYPYKSKAFFCVQWKPSAIRVKGRTITLSNGNGSRKLRLKLPTFLRDCNPNTVELIWRNGYWLSITLDSLQSQEVTGSKTAGCDLGEIHAVTATDGDEAIVVNGRQLRSVKRLRNKRVAEVQELMSRCKRGSRRWKKLKRARSRIQAKAHRQTRDLNHKISRKTIDWCVENHVSTLVVGDVTDIARNTRTEKRLNSVSRQKVSQWEHYRQKQYLHYKAQEVGIEVKSISEAYTTQTCPRCGYRYKPKGRNYSCVSCGLQMHRDIVGAVNIRTRYLTNVLKSHQCFVSPRSKYLRIDYESRSSSGAGVVPSELSIPVQLLLFENIELCDTQESLMPSG